jgi:hypothetical protein
MAGIMIIGPFHGEVAAVDNIQNAAYDNNNMFFIIDKSSNEYKREIVDSSKNLIQNGNINVTFSFICSEKDSSKDNCTDKMQVDEIKNSKYNLQLADYLFKCGVNNDIKSGTINYGDIISNLPNIHPLKNLTKTIPGNIAAARLLTRIEVMCPEDYLNQDQLDKANKHYESTYETPIMAEKIRFYLIYGKKIPKYQQIAHQED